jgi:hypothetical protein
VDTSETCFNWHLFRASSEHEERFDKNMPGDIVAF